MTFTPSVEDLAMKLKATADAQLEGSVDQLSQAWKRAWAEIEREWHDAMMDLASAADNGVWPTRSQVTRSMKAQQALESTSKQLRTLLDAAFTADDISSLANLARSQQLSIIQAQMPPDYQMPMQRYDPLATKAIVDRTMQQITVKHWALSDAATESMKSSLVRGIAVGDNPRTAAADMMKRVEGVFNGGRARAENIARTEMMDAVRTAAQQSQDSMNDVVKGWRWVAGLSERTCPACLSMHGRVFPPTDPGPQGHPSCRCGRAPVTKTWRELGIDLDEPDEIAETGIEWFNKQPAAQQKRLLGQTRYDAWKSGKFPPEQWAVLKQNPGWRPSWDVGKPGGPSRTPFKFPTPNPAPSRT